MLLCAVYIEFFFYPSDFRTLDPLPVSLAFHIGAFYYSFITTPSTPHVRGSPDPFAVLLAVHIETSPISTRLRVTIDPLAVSPAFLIAAFPCVPVPPFNPLAVPLAFHIGAFMYVPIQVTPDPLPMLFAIHIGTFLYAPFRLMDPSSMKIAFLEVPSVRP